VVRVEIVCLGDGNGRWVLKNAGGSLGMGGGAQNGRCGGDMTMLVAIGPSLVVVVVVVAPVHVADCKSIISKAKMKEK
jgi:hypothetical protein